MLLGALVSGQLLLRALLRYFYERSKSDYENIFKDRLFSVLLKKDFGQKESVSRFSPSAQALLGLLLGLCIGFYDGFFGPGTGNFLIMGLIFIYGMDFLHASADTKTINAMTNISAFLMYTIMGVGNIPLGVTMGLFNMAGAHVGVKMAVLKGSRFIRVLFIVMSFGLLLKQIIEFF